MFVITFTIRKHCFFTKKIGQKKPNCDICQFEWHFWDFEVGIPKLSSL
jgi:hypothetical protein